MPILKNRIRIRELNEPSSKGNSPAFLSVCANPNCASGWLHAWRRRTTPVIERGWSCSSGCTRALLNRFIRREGEARSLSATGHRHRIPIGLVLVEKGWIGHEHLKRGLEAQKSENAGRIGEWLVRHCGLEEHQLTKALSIQWNCPVFSLDGLPTLSVVSALPRLFMDSFQFFPVRLSNTGTLYIAFEDHIDHSVTLGIERITGLKVEAGLIHGSEFDSKHHESMQADFLPARMIEADNMEQLLQSLTSLIEKEKPLDTQIVRIHDFYWLRLWKESPRPAEPPYLPQDGVLDVICSLGKFV